MTVPFTKSASYDVGYGKPPRHTQFQKGRSGNPGGRPRKSPVARLKELALKEAYRAVVVKDDGEAVPVPAIQAVLRSQMELAAAGNVRAQHAVLTLIRDIELVNVTPAASAVMSAFGAYDDDAVVDNYDADADYGFDADENDDAGDGVGDDRFDHDGANGSVDDGAAAENGAEWTQQADADGEERQTAARSTSAGAPRLADGAPSPDDAAARPAGPRTGNGETDPGEAGPREMDEAANVGEEAGMTAAPGAPPALGVGTAHASRRGELPLGRRARRRSARNRKFPVVLPVLREADVAQVSA